MIASNLCGRYIYIYILIAFIWIIVNVLLSPDLQYCYKHPYIVYTIIYGQTLVVTLLWYGYFKAHQAIYIQLVIS